MDKIINYIMTDKGRLSPSTVYPIYHNLLSSDLDTISKEFSTISSKRKRRSSTNGYHIIMSWDKKDSESGVLTQGVIEELSNKFIEFRGSEAICLAVPHTEEDHLHVHFLFSSHDISGQNSLRVNNKQFRQIRSGMEAYQLKHYPTLRSDVYEHYRSTDKNKIFSKLSSRISDGEYYVKKKITGETDKEKLKHILKEIMKASKTNEDWLKAIHNHTDLELNMYKGKSNGVVYLGRKYRFKRLGLNHPEMLQLEELNRLSKQSTHKEKSR